MKTFGAGDLIGKRYKLIEEIGHGGMAFVWKAMDTKKGNILAIKILRSDAKFSNIEERFQIEAVGQAKVKSSNVVKIHDVGGFDVADDPKWIAMEYVQGKTLQQIIQRKKVLQPIEAINYTLQILKGLYAMHQQGFVHRDIKPANLLINEQGELKITDFGIVMLNQYQNLTQEGKVVGSVQYIAPEIIKGKRATNQADIYSVGVIFYEMLTGIQPFNDTDIAKVLARHAEGNVKDITKVNSAVSKELAGYIKKAMSVTLDGRYKNVQEMFDNLREYATQNGLISEVTAINVDPIYNQASDANETAKIIDRAAGKTASTTPISKPIATTKEIEKPKETLVRRPLNTTEKEMIHKRLASSKAKTSEQDRAISEKVSKQTKTINNDFDIVTNETTVSVGKVVDYTNKKNTYTPNNSLPQAHSLVMEQKDIDEINKKTRVILGFLVVILLLALILVGVSGALLIING